MLLRGQSAMEFLMAYSYLFLIITVAISVLVLYISFPRSTLPTSCSAFSSFSCTDALLINTAPGASLVLALSDGEPGIINVTYANSIINYQKSTSGYCLPSQASDGQTIYCIINFTFTPVIQNVYFGTFSVTGNYCAQAADNLSTVSCPQNSNFVYSGSFRIQSVNQTVGDQTLNALIYNSPDYMYSVPIQISNGEPVATPAPFQQFLDFPDVAYKKYINNGWSNVEFSTLPGGKGTVLEAWIERNPRVIATANTMVWVNLPTGIPAQSSITIYADILNTNVMSASGPTGEMALLSNTYAQYDNGASVFPFYDDFNGTVLSSLWTSSGNVFVNNGLTIIGTSSNSITSISAFSALNKTLDISWYANTVTGGNLNFGFNSLGLATTNALYWAVSQSSTRQEAVSANATGSNTIIFNYGKTGQYVYYVGLNSTNSIAGFYTYGNEIVTGSVAIKQFTSFKNIYTGQMPITLGVTPSTGTNFQVYWIRMRNSPPDGVMPTANYSNAIFQIV